MIVHAIRAISLATAIMTTPRKASLEQRVDPARELGPVATIAAGAENDELPPISQGENA